MWALLSINIDFNFYKRWAERRSSLLIQLCNAEFLSLSQSLFPGCVYQTDCFDQYERTQTTIRLYATFKCCSERAFIEL